MLRSFGGQPCYNIAKPANQTYKCATYSLLYAFFLQLLTMKMKSVITLA